MKNYLWNMFACINNGQLAKRSFVLHIFTKKSEKFLNILWDEGFILGYKNYCLLKNNKTTIKIFLKYNNGRSAINAIKPISKPGRKVYYTIKQIWKISSNNTCIIFSTNKGLKTIDECKKYKLGGEPYIILN